MILIRMADGCYRYVSSATLATWRAWRVAHPAWRPPVRAAASILACGAVAGQMPHAAALSPVAGIAPPTYDAPRPITDAGAFAPFIGERAGYSAIPGLGGAPLGYREGQPVPGFLPPAGWGPYGVDGPLTAAPRPLAPLAPSLPIAPPTAVPAPPFAPLAALLLTLTLWFRKGRPN